VIELDPAFEVWQSNWLRWFDNRRRNVEHPGHALACRQRG